MINVHVHCMYCNKLNMHGFVWFDALAFFCITCLQQIVCKCEYNMHALCMNYSILLHKHQ